MMAVRDSVVAELGQARCELDALRQTSEKAFAERNELVLERNGLLMEIDEMSEEREALEARLIKGGAQAGEGRDASAVKLADGDADAEGLRQEGDALALRLREMDDALRVVEAERDALMALVDDMDPARAAIQAVANARPQQQPGSPGSPSAGYAGGTSDSLKAAMYVWLLTCGGRLLQAVGRERGHRVARRESRDARREHSDSLETLARLGAGAGVVLFGVAAGAVAVASLRSVRSSSRRAKRL